MFSTKEDREKRIIAKRVQELKDIFILMNINDIPYMLKNIVLLPVQETIDVIGFAIDEILSVRSFSIQATWLNHLLNVRENLIISCIIDKLAESRKLLTTTEIIRDTVYKVRLDALQERYSITVNFFIDNYGDNDPAIVLWSLARRDIYDEVLTPTYIFKKVLASYGEESLSLAMENTSNMVKHFPTIYRELSNTWTPANLIMVKQIFMHNAKIYKWEDVLEDTIKHKTSNIVNLH